ncbi:MAG: hypothetical protein WAX89_07795 [Alphaproteobacteria bacterium]
MAALHLHRAALVGQQTKGVWFKACQAVNGALLNKHARATQAYDEANAEKARLQQQWADKKIKDSLKREELPIIGPVFKRFGAAARLRTDIDVQSKAAAQAAAQLTTLNQKKYIKDSLARAERLKGKTTKIQTDLTPHREAIAAEKDKIAANKAHQAAAKAAAERTAQEAADKAARDQHHAAEVARVQGLIQGYINNVNSLPFDDADKQRITNTLQTLFSLAAQQPQAAETELNRFVTHVDNTIAQVRERQKQAIITGSIADFTAAMNNIIAQLPEHERAAWEGHRDHGIANFSANLKAQELRTLHAMASSWVNAYATARAELSGLVAKHPQAAEKGLTPDRIGRLTLNQLNTAIATFHEELAKKEEVDTMNARIEANMAGLNETTKGDILFFLDIHEKLAKDEASGMPILDTLLTIDGFKEALQEKGAELKAMLEHEYQETDTPLTKQLEALKASTAFMMTEFALKLEPKAFKAFATTHKQFIDNHVGLIQKTLADSALPRYEKYGDDKKSLTSLATALEGRSDEFIKALQAGEHAAAKEALAEFQAFDLIPPTQQTEVAPATRSLTAAIAADIPDTTVFASTPAESAEAIAQIQPPLPAAEPVASSPRPTVSIPANAKERTLFWAKRHASAVSDVTNPSVFLENSEFPYHDTMQEAYRARLLAMCAHLTSQAESVMANVQSHNKVMRVLKGINLKNYQDAFAGLQRVVAGIEHSLNNTPQTVTMLWQAECHLKDAFRTFADEHDLKETPKTNAGLQQAERFIDKEINNHSTAYKIQHHNWLIAAYEAEQAQPSPAQPAKLAADEADLTARATGIEEITELAADLNGDGVVDEADVAIAKRFAHSRG